MNIKQCSKCNNDMNFLMKFREGADTYYCSHCNVTIDIVRNKEFAVCNPVVAIEDIIYKIANIVPANIYEEKNISKDTFLKVLIDKKKKESLKNL